MPSTKLAPELHGPAAAVADAGHAMQLWVSRRQRLAEELPKFNAAVEQCHQEANFKATQEAADDVAEQEVEEAESMKALLSEHPDAPTETAAVDVVSGGNGHHDTEHQDTETTQQGGHPMLTRQHPLSAL